MEVSSNEAPNDIENPPIPLDISIQQELDGLSPLTPLCCIYRVPERLRRAIPIAYTPQVVSIGPLHHGSKGLIGMEEHKMRYLQDFISRTKISLKDYLQMIRGQEEKLRNCYAETIGLESDAFVKIILVDAAFIIEMLLKNHYDFLRDVNDRIFNKPWMGQDVWHDMLLLENQLPFFILDELYDKVDSHINNENEKLSLVHLSHYFFRSMHLMHMEGTTEKLEKIRSSSSEVKHFVDFIKKLYLTLDQPPPTGSTTTKTSARTRAANKPTTQAESELETLTAPSMTELHLAGVKFKVRSSENLFDIQFRDGILEIPKLNISPETELTITNLMAFEQCHCEENYINDYVVLMDRLVNTSQDVELLVEHGIVENWLGENSAAATLINNLAYGAIANSSDFQYAALFYGLNKHRKRHWNRWKANLSHKYFNTPWAGISVAAAIVLIALTILQTVFSGMSVI